MKRIQKKSVILTSLIFTIILLLNIIPFSAKAEELAHLAWRWEVKAIWIQPKCGGPSGDENVERVI